MIMRLNNESFEAMYCRKENVLTQRILPQKKSTFLYISVKKNVQEFAIFFSFVPFETAVI